MFLVIFLEKLSKSLHFYMVKIVKMYYSNIRSKIIRIMNNFPKKLTTVIGAARHKAAAAEEEEEEIEISYFCQRMKLNINQHT
jgi:hypothetical protein